MFRLFSVVALALSLSAASVPRKAPAFSMSLADGSKVSLSQYRGKVVLMAYILTTCSHCQAVTGILSQLQTDLGPRGLQVLESAVEDDAQHHIADFTAHYKPSFPVGWSDRADVAPVLQPDNKLHIMPQSVLIDRKGTIRSQFYGDDPLFDGDAAKNLTALIEQYLK